ncbi:MAG TPA: hypothetical protein VF174_11100 [Micromonosporaceae bacterium]
MSDRSWSESGWSSTESDWSSERGGIGAGQAGWHDADYPAPTWSDPYRETLTAPPVKVPRQARPNGATYGDEQHIRHFSRYEGGALHGEAAAADAEARHRGAEPDGPPRSGAAEEPGGGGAPAARREADRESWPRSEAARSEADRDPWPGTRREAVGKPVPADRSAWARGAEATAGHPAPADTLPQRVPGEPDVPTVPEVPAAEPSAETPELARIATHLRRDDTSAPPHERPDGFDVDAILAAVRGVDGVRDASVRTTPDGAHRLRLDLADGADAAEVSRTVARLLQERMGLAAAPQTLPSGSPVAPRRRRRSGTRHGHDAPTRWTQPDEPPATPVGSSTRGAGDLPRAGRDLPVSDTRPSRPLASGRRPGPRVVIDHVQVSTFGLDANVEVRLVAGERSATGRTSGPAVDGYVQRLAAAAAAAAIDELLAANPPARRGRCFVEHTAVVPLGTCEVAVVVVLLTCDGWVEQLAGSAVVTGDPRQAVVRATLAAVNRRLVALLA